MEIKTLLRRPYRWLLLLWHRMLHVGNSVYVHPLVRIENPGAIVLGDDVQVRWNSELLCGRSGKISIGSHGRVDHHVTLQAMDGRICIGRNGYVGPFSILRGDGGLDIGNDVLISPQVIIMAANHDYCDSTRLIRMQEDIREGIWISDDVWIGAGAKIMDGVAIGTGAVIGAGAVVTRDIPSYAIAVGVPAHVVGQRSPGAKHCLLSHKASGK